VIFWNFFGFFWKFFWRCPERATCVARHAPRTLAQGMPLRSDETCRALRSLPCRRRRRNLRDRRKPNARMGFPVFHSHRQWARLPATGALGSRSTSAHRSLVIDRRRGDASRSRRLVE
jgi:hypothetical protein